MREIKFRAWSKNTNSFLDDLSYTHKFDPYGHVYSPQGSDNYVLMQYTGLKDKNGKEIYEGDVVKITDFCKYNLLTKKYQPVVSNAQVVFGKHQSSHEAGYSTHDELGCFLADKGMNQVWDNVGEDVSLFTTIGELGDITNHWVEVIGNIYENPELLTPHQTH